MRKIKKIMYEWKTQKGADNYRASLSIQFPPEATFVYRAYGHMAETSLPCITALAEHQSELASDDVIVIGDQRSDRYLLAGALTAFRSSSIFRILRRGGCFTSIELEQPDIKNGEIPEELIVLEGNDWCELLFQYADAAAKKMGVKTFKESKNITGYCTWYYYYKDVKSQNLWDNVEALAKKRELYSAEYIQIDDGYQRYYGDWLELNDNWKLSLKEAAENIKSHGMKAGIWLMPFIASTASNLYKKHPDWFVQDNFTGKAVIRKGWASEPEKEWCCLDATIPEVNEYIANIFKTMWDMGYCYFKLDGLSFGLTRGKRHNPDMTAVESFRKLLSTIREAVPSALLMACSEPFMPCLGFFDHARVGYDTSRNFNSVIPNQNYPILSSCDILNAQRETMSNFWKFDRWFRCDPDALMARQDNANYTEGEARFSVLTGILTGIAITSDNFNTIAPERMKILGTAQKYRMRNVRPFLYRCGQWFQFFKGTINGKYAVAVFNDSESEMLCDLSNLGLPEKTIDLLTEKVVEKVYILPKHDAALFTVI